MAKRGAEYLIEDGISCPECGSFFLSVVDSRPSFGTIRRSRKCHNDHRFQTVEVLVPKGESAKSAAIGLEHWRRRYYDILANIRTLLNKEPL